MHRLKIYNLSLGEGVSMLKKDWFETMIKQECKTNNVHTILKVYVDMIEMCNKFKEEKKETLSS